MRINPSLVPFTLRYIAPKTLEAKRKHSSKQLKSFLLPRRHYDSLASLKQAVLEALNLLNEVRATSKVGGA